jgi:hypothetical protein
MVVQFVLTKQVNVEAAEVSFPEEAGEDMVGETEEEDTDHTAGVVVMVEVELP